MFSICFLQRPLHYGVSRVLRTTAGAWGSLITPLCSAFKRIATSKPPPGKPTTCFGSLMSIQAINVRNQFRGKVKDLELTEL